MAAHRGTIVNAGYAVMPMTAWVSRLGGYRRQRRPTARARSTRQHLPWEATYWKTFPRGYRVTVEWQREAPNKAPDWDSYERWIKWYNNPFEA